MQSGMKILVTARDPGAAHRAGAFVEDCRRTAFRGLFVVLAQGPAVDILPGYGLNVEKHDGVSLRTARSLLASIQPDYVLCGMAAPGYHLDEAVMEAASERQLPRGAIQDFWGYLGSFPRWAGPKDIFVLDQLAVDLTRKRAPTQWACNIVEAGGFRRPVESPVKRLPKLSSRPAVGFFGQPDEIPGYRRQVAGFFSAVGEISTPLTIRIRPHPKEKDFDKYETGMNLAEVHDINYFDGPSCIEDNLLSVDVVVSCFSSAGIDHHFLQADADEPLGTILYYTEGCEIAGFIQEQVGSAELPSVELGLAERCYSPQSLARTLRKNLGDPAAAARYADRIKAIWIDSSESHERLRETILDSTSKRLR